MNNWHARGISDLVLESGTDINNGRTVHKTDRKRKRNNKIFLIPTTEPLSIVKRMASDASLVLLSITFFISALINQTVDSLFGIAFIVLSFVFGVLILHRSSLRISNSYRMLLPAARIVENGTLCRLSVLDVEVNDLITFTQGDIIVADARLVDSSSLTVAERVFNEITGLNKYRKVEKDHLYISESDEVSHSPNMVYAGSMVISGKGRAIVTAIGNDTFICQHHSPISIIPENDRPEFLKLFWKKTRRFSLAVLLAVIPLSLIAICLNHIAWNENIDFLYAFTLSLALAATSMSEVIIASAETIITGELLPSSSVSKSESMRSSKVTKLSVAEELAQTDTFLILSPDVLIDHKRLVRQIYFSGKRYRFDAIESNDINDLAKQISPYFDHMPSSSVNKDDRIIHDFFARFNNSVSNPSANTKFLRNFPMKDSISCVFEFDSNGNPSSYVVSTRDFNLITRCSYFRTEGGGLWKFSQKDIDEVKMFFDDCFDSDFLTPVAFFSHSAEESGFVFEGIISIGEEFPYSDGETIDNLLEAGIQPILVLETENNRSLEIAKACGLVESQKDIAVFSDYQKAGMSVSDAHLSTKVFVGFGRKGTQTITKRLADNSRKVLPIIKDSANRYDVSPFNVYATTSEFSLDSVKISSSLNIIPHNGKNKIGGLRDTLKLVLSSSMAFLKLGIYKNYLIFASFLRIFTVLLPLMFGYSFNILTPTSILLCGFFSDFAALFSISYFKGIPVKAQNAVSETKKMFSLSSALISAFISLFVSATICCVTGYLVKTEAILAADAYLTVSGLVMIASIAAIGGFLLLLRGRTRGHKINICYLLIVIFVLLFAVAEIMFPGFVISIDLISFKTATLPYFAVVSSLTLISVVILGNISSFSH